MNENENMNMEQETETTMEGTSEKSGEGHGMLIGAIVLIAGGLLAVKKKLFPGRKYATVNHGRFGKTEK